jgi:hypothetical protein
MKELKLGVIGLSPGNGHPYSWSAIFNGYDEQAMGDCPFPVIPEYLSRQRFPQDSIPGARVTHIWTQDPEISKHVAQASKIANIVSELTEMIGEVDAVLLARDDGENHFEMARPFIEAGLPLYIDKPLALSLKEAEKIMALEKYEGQIFSCSGLKFSPSLQLSEEQKVRLGPIRTVIGLVPKDWDKYSLHMIDPFLTGFPKLGPIRSAQRCCLDGRTVLTVLWESGLQATFLNSATSAGSIQLQFIGEKSSETLIFSDTYQAFKSSLEKFMLSIHERRRVIPLEETLASIEILALGSGRETAL